MDEEISMCFGCTIVKGCKEVGRELEFKNSLQAGKMSVFSSLRENALLADF